MRSRRSGPAALSLVALATVAAGLLPARDPSPPDERDPLVVFLVRHAEKEAEGRDPELTEAGCERARRLAQLLRDSGLQRVHSTDFARTRSTATPVAAALGLEIEPYDPRDLRDFVGGLRAAGGRHLVVGHSNTTPAAVHLLGGSPGAPIDEAAEYDRLYLVTPGKDGTAETVLLRYGAPFEPARDG